MAVAGTLLCVLPVSAHAQNLTVGDPWEDYARVLGVTGLAAPTSWVIRPLSTEQALAGVGGTGHPWSARLAPPDAPRSRRAWTLTPAPASLRLYVNSAFPAGQNDGAVWQGRGLTAALDLGGTLRWGALTVAIRPTLMHTENRAFALASVVAPGRTIYANPWHPRGSSTPAIDEPQRFGPDPYWSLDPGQSSVRVEAGGVVAGFGTENLWWGPGIQNAIIMSNNAAGIPHAWLGTSRPRSVGIGRVEAQWIWGRLTASRWSDSVVADTARFLTGLVVSFQPRFLPGLTVGGTRAFSEVVPAGGVPFADYLVVFEGITKKGFASPSNPYGNDLRDQMLSLFGRWVFPESGFETYVEWARNDHNWDLRDVIQEPEHSQAYTLGFQKVTEVSGHRLVRLSWELSHLQRTRTLELRATPLYYAHHRVKAGYTQRGQVIGAGIGTGGDAQRVGGDLFTHWGSVGIFLGRQVHDNDAYYEAAIADPSLTFRTHHVELQVGATGVVFRGPLDLTGQLVWTRHYNRYFIPRNDVTNVRLDLALWWRPRGWLHGSAQGERVGWQSPVGP